VLGRVLHRLGSLSVAKHRPVDEAEEAPGLGKLGVRGLVAVEALDRALRLALDFLAPGVEILGGGMAHEQTRQDRARFQPGVIRGDRRLDGLVEVHLGPGELARLHQRLPQVGQELEPLTIVGRQQVDRAPQQVGGGRHVGACERAPPRGREVTGGAGAELAAVVVEGPEVGEVVA